ncbi:MAG: DUF1772 domain-containing protein [Woeseia sp.]
MSPLVTLAGIAALLGSGLIGGVFFAFSSFVMKALARLPSPEGIAAMQSINVVVINRSFLGAFMGTAVLSLGIGGLAALDSSHPSAPYFLGAAIFYFAGTFLVTMVFNVPLNDKLAAVAAADPAAVELWEHYLGRWTMWNHVRTAAAMMAVLLYTLGLIQNGGA